MTTPPPRRPTPRPTFEQPTALLATDRNRHIWGDSQSGYVIDRVYLSSENLHVLEFSLVVGGRFGHSPTNPTIFAADELLYVLEGELLLSDPSTGETQRARKGEAVFFQRDTWHHGRAGGDEGVRVLEFFSPTPATGASSDYARKQPYLDQVATLDSRLLQNWPNCADSYRQSQRIAPVREHDLAWATRSELEMALFASTENLSVARCFLRPGCSAEPELHRGEEFLIVLSGGLTVLTPDAPSANCLFLGTGDACVLPPNTPHSYLCSSDEGVTWLSGVGPGWSDTSDIWPAG